MVALIDWDNLEDNDRRQGPRYVADKLWTTLGALVPRLVQGVQDFNVRLYGGWYGWNGFRNITPMATQLTADVQNDFPFILRDPISTQTIKISGELAHSLLRLPRQVLPHTFRQRQGSPRLSCGDPQRFGCAVPNCPMAIVHQFFALRKCPETSCTRTIDQLLTRAYLNREKSELSLYSMIGFPRAITSLRAARIPSVSSTGMTAIGSMSL